MYNIKEILRIIRTNRERRERRLILERDRRDQQALKLISRYKDLYDLLGDAVYLGQVRGLEGAFRYVLEVRKADYLSEKISLVREARAILSGLPTASLTKRPRGNPRSPISFISKRILS